MKFSGRHWMELLRRAREDALPYAAAALYPHASPAHRGWLAPRLFDSRRDRLLLASAAFVPPSVLAALATLAALDGADAMLARRLARNPATPAGSLAALWRAGGETECGNDGGVGDGRERLLLARHPSMPRALLEEIAQGATQIEVLRALCENAGAAPEVMAALEQRQQPALQRLLAVNLATDAATLLALWRGTQEAAVRAQILLHPHCPAALLEAMPESALERRCLAQQARVPLPLLQRLAADAEPAVRRAAAAHAALAAPARLALCFDPDPGVRRVVAARADLSARMAGWLLEDADAWVRRTVARNAACPVDLLEVAVRDTQAEVRRGAARHPACPAALLVRLAADPVAWVQAGVAYRHDLPLPLLRRLARSADIDVLAGVARHPATPAMRLARLAAHESPDVRRAVILNRQAPRKVLLALRQDGYALHRAMLLDHPNLTDTDRWRMRDDPDPEVRFRLFAHFAHFSRPATQAGKRAPACDAAPTAARQQQAALMTMETT